MTRKKEQSISLRGQEREKGTTETLEEDALDVDKAPVLASDYHFRYRGGS